MLKDLAVDYFISKTMEAIKGKNPGLLKLLGRHFLQQSLHDDPPIRLMERWLFTVNNLEPEQAKRMYYEAIANAVDLTEADAQNFVSEALKHNVSPASNG